MNRAWKAEVEAIAQLIVNDFAWVSQTDCFCTPWDCIHEPRFTLHMTNIHAEEQTIDFFDSETIREADNRASEIRGAFTHRQHSEPAQHSATAQSGHSDNGAA